MSFGVEKGSRVEKTFVGKTELTETSLEGFLNGEELDVIPGYTDLRMVSEVRLVFLDHYREVGDTRPNRLVREFRALEENETSDVEFDGEPEKHELRRSSALQGKSVVFTWNPDEGKYEKAFEGKREAAAELLQDLVADTDLLEFLPGKAVEEGDTWEIEARGSWRLTNPGGYLHLLGEGQPTDVEVERQFEENQSGVLLATYVGQREVDGTTVAVISLRGELASHLEDETEDVNGDPVEERTRITARMEGEISWHLAEGRPHAFRVETEAKMQHMATTTWTDETSGAEMTYRVEAAMKGSSAHTGAWRTVK